jgi:PAS domain S-box-containing protein
MSSKIKKERVVTTYDKNYTKEYLKILETISDFAIIAQLDPQAIITFANRNFCKISGYTLEEIKGENYFTLYSKHNDNEFFIHMISKIKNGYSWRGDLKKRGKNGTFYWVDTQIIPIFNLKNEIESYISIDIDITESKNLKASLESVSKMATLGEMSSVIVHEINNPLTVIDLAADFLKKELKLKNLYSGSIEDKIEKIIKSSKKISKIIRGVKTFSFIGLKNEDFIKVNLVNFIEETLSYCKCDNAEIDFIICKIPDIEFDCRPDQICQVLVNLLKNAQDATLNLNKKWVKLAIEIDHTSDFLIFSIHDSGQGIQESIAKKMLEPFFTTKEVGKGTGLGLSISKSIIESHSGEFYLNTNDLNTNFVFKIPIRQFRMKATA